jgi:AcrR family transcriptional regulator
MAADPTTSARARSRRDRPAKAPLSADAVVDAAIAIAKAEGLAAVTMRRVATELDTGPASLYVYVSNREELLRAMLDRVAGGIPRVEPDPKRWRAQLYDLLDAFRVALEEHPGLSAVLPGVPVVTDTSLGSIENLLGLLVAGGIPAQDAAWACDILMLIVTATAGEADIRRDAGHEIDDDFVEEMRTTFAAVPADRYPNIASHADALVAGEGDDRFRFSIETFLDGLVARSARK